MRKYFAVNKATFEEQKDKAEEASDSKEQYAWNDIQWSDVQILFDNGILRIRGYAYSEGKYLGGVCIETPMKSEMITLIVEHYMKRLGKLKTVLEATK